MIYGFKDPIISNDETKMINEKVIQNLISIASNPKLFDALGVDTRERLIAFVSSYTKNNLDAIEKYQKVAEEREEYYKNGGYEAARAGRNRG